MNEEREERVQEARVKREKGGMRKMKIGGRSYPCRVTMGALLRFKRATGHDVSSMRGDDMEELMIFLHSCIMSACKADGEECTLSMEDMADMLQPDDLTLFYAAMDEGAKKKEEERVPEEREEREAEERVTA